MQTISFTDANDVMFNVTLDGNTYKIKMSWNPVGFWTLSFWTIQKEPILNNVRVVPNMPLLLGKHCFNVPVGEIVVVSNSEELHRQSFVEGKATLCYIEENDFLSED